MRKGIKERKKEQKIRKSINKGKRRERGTL